MKKINKLFPLDLKQYKAIGEIKVNFYFSDNIQYDYYFINLISKNKDRYYCINLETFKIAYDKEWKNSFEKLFKIIIDKMILSINEKDFNSFFYHNQDNYDKDYSKKLYLIYRRLEDDIFYNDRLYLFDNIFNFLIKSDKNKYNVKNKTILIPDNKSEILPKINFDKKIKEIKNYHY